MTVTVQFRCSTLIVMRALHADFPTSAHFEKELFSPFSPPTVVNSLVVSVFPAAAATLN